MNALLVDERVLGPDHGAELMALVIDGEVDIRIGVFLAEGGFDIGQGEVLAILIDIDLLQAEDIGILADEVLQHFVVLRLDEMAHPCGVPAEDGEAVGAPSV